MTFRLIVIQIVSVNPSNELKTNAINCSINSQHFWAFKALQILWITNLVSAMHTLKVCTIRYNCIRKCSKIYFVLSGKQCSSAIEIESTIISPCKRSKDCWFFGPKLHAWKGLWFGGKSLDYNIQFLPNLTLDRIHETSEKVLKNLVRYGSDTYRFDN